LKTTSKFAAQCKTINQNDNLENVLRCKKTSSSAVWWTTIININAFSKAPLDAKMVLDNLENDFRGTKFCKRPFAGGRIYHNLFWVLERGLSMQLFSA